MAVAQSKQAGNITIGKGTLAQPYIGVIPLVASTGPVANAPNVATLTPTPTSVAFLCGFSVTGTGASAKNPVVVTVNGLLGGQMRYYAYMFESPVNAINTPLVMRFDPPLPGEGPGMPITITCPASGSGGLINCVNANGFASTPVKDPAI